jgi:hypothetical protein
LARQLVVIVQNLSQTLAVGEDLLGSFLVLPKLRMGYLFLEELKFLASLGNVKESSGCRQRAASVRRIPFAVLRSRSLLKSRCQVPGFNAWLSAFSRQLSEKAAELKNPSALQSRKFLFF